MRFFLGRKAEGQGGPWDQVYWLVNVLFPCVVWAQRTRSALVPKKNLIQLSPALFWRSKHSSRQSGSVQRAPGPREPSFFQLLPRVLGRQHLICPLSEHSVQWIQQDSPAQRVDSSAQACQAPWGACRAREPRGGQPLQLQHAAAPRPVPATAASQAGGRGGRCGGGQWRQQRPAELRVQQAGHVLCQRPARPAQAAAATGAGQEGQRPAVPVPGTEPGQLAGQQRLLFVF